MSNGNNPNKDQRRMKLKWLGEIAVSDLCWYHSSQLQFDLIQLLVLNSITMAWK